MTARRLAILALATLAASCGGGSSPTDATASTQCTTIGQVTFVRDTLQNIYYWYKDLADPDPASFGSPEAYLDAVRYRPLDTTFSYITSKASSDAFFSESQFIGFGLSYKQTAELALRIAQVFPGSSAAEAGLDRGDELLTIGGKTVAELIQSGEIATSFGPDQVGVTVDVSWRDLEGRERSATLTKRVVTIPTVSQTAVLDAGALRVGYVHLRNFVTPSVAALDSAFTGLGAAGVTDLVLDLRYNGGGLVSVAQHLAGLIGGPSLSGQVFIQFVHNDKNTSRNSALRFESLPPALGVPRLVVIATHASASASEAMINGLRPYMDVRVVGDTTYGKPVGQYGFDFCDKVLYPVSFLVTNARGEADYFGGIPADCAAADDLDHPLASGNEASLAEALYVLRTGHCSAGAAAQAGVQARFRSRVKQLPLDGWRRQLNAW
jgi:carboxyl-terminal processing protease